MDAMVCWQVPDNTFIPISMIRPTWCHRRIAQSKVSSSSKEGSLSSVKVVKSVSKCRPTPRSLSRLGMVFP